MTRLTGLAPIVGPETRLLVLGSFPSVASLRDQQYYAHPQNHFWKILQALWPEFPLPEVSDYAARCAWVRARGLGIWDVYASCERQGSLDSAIRDAVVNDFSALVATCPQLKVIAHNGGESFKHAKHTAALGLPVVRLPSSSPANASWSLERKRAAWYDAAVQAGLL
ncbi:DNA-deoxyinosine glycosylase [Hylemonella sp. W303a]|uniref:DNA-deoxyinosine glycosylase n=1 Tax=Hylemonella sp. W303a TaxID=3389873 RepID=UPI00396B086F